MQIVFYKPIIQTSWKSYVPANRVQVREDKTEEVAVVPCDNSVTWSYDHESHLFTFKETGTCLTLRRLDNAQDEVGLAECDPDSELQQWYITHFNPGGMAYKDLA